MKILVTGGAGFIGSNVVDRYLEEGHEVVVVDNLSSGKVENLNPDAKFYLLDIRSAELAKVFELERPDVVNHHAAQKSVPKSVQDPRLDADINVMGLLNLLELCVKYKTRKFIFISSGGALVGDAKKIPTDETHEPKLISPYAITKYVSEKYLYFYAITYGLKYTVLRYANVYGPRQIPEGECGVVPIFMEQLLNGRPATLFAYSDMPRGCSRDYVYVEDVARANSLALVRGDNEIINIGSSREVYTEDVYNLLQEIMGTDYPIIRAGERVGDVRRSVLDITKARQVLGWEPEVALREGLRKTYEWAKQQLRGQKIS